MSRRRDFHIKGGPQYCRSVGSALRHSYIEHLPEAGDFCRKKQTPHTRSRNLAPENTRRSWLDPTRTSSAQCSSMNHYQQARYAWSRTSSRPTFCCLPSILTIEATKPSTCRFEICHGPLRARIPNHPIQPRFAPPLIHHQETPAPSTPSHHRSPHPTSL